MMNEILWIGHPYTEINENWQHPDLQYFLNKLDKTEYSKNNLGYTGNIVRVDMNWKNSGYTVIVYTEDVETMFDLGGDDWENVKKNGYSEKAKLASHNLIEEIKIMIGEDVWAPGGKQFYFSDFGQKINEKNDIWDDQWTWSMSPDLSINVDIINNIPTINGYDT